MDRLPAPFQRPALSQGPQWQKQFSIRQLRGYHKQENRLRAAGDESIIDTFLACYKSDLEPPRRYEVLKNFLNKTRAKSFSDALSINHADKRMLAIVDDRCDLSANIIVPDNTSVLPLRPWDSLEYNRKPPQGLNVNILGADAQKLNEHLQKDVLYA
jgi:hypothetical protein